MCFKNKIFNQFTKPESNRYGSKIIKSMNKYHQPLHDFAREYLDIKSYKTILDIGCGGGKNIYDMSAQNSNAKIYGLDHSEEAIRQSNELNATEVKNNRVFLDNANIHESKIIPTQIDLITAFETIYFWQDLESDFKRIFELLSPGGVFCIAQECGSLKYAPRLEKKVKNLKIFTAEDVKQKLEKVGFTKIEINKQSNKMEGYTIRGYKI